MGSTIRFRFLCATVLLLFLFSTLMLSTSASSNQETAIFGISEADYSMAQAYEAILDAEEAGADVSGLLDRLGFAGEYLAEAHIWYRLGDFENATRFAGLCYDVVEEARSEELRYYAQPGPMTDPRQHAHLLDSLPTEIPALCKVIRGFLLHTFNAPHYGVELSEARKHREWDIRPVSEMLDQVFRLDDSPLSESRPPEKRLTGICRHFATSCLTHIITRRYFQIQEIHRCQTRKG